MGWASGTPWFATLPPYRSIPDHGVDALVIRARCSRAYDGDRATAVGHNDALSLPDAS